MPGNITQVVVNQYAAQNIDLYCGTTQLMASDNTSTGQTPSGTLQTAQTAATQMTWNVSGNYKFFDLKKGSGTSYITSIVITYANSTTSYISEKNCCTNLGQINGSVSVTQLTEGVNKGKLQATWEEQDDQTGWADEGLIIKFYKDGETPTCVHTSEAQDQDKEGRSYVWIGTPDYCSEYYATLTPVRAAITSCEGEEQGKSESNCVTAGQYTYHVTLDGMQLKAGEEEAADNCSDFDAIYEPTGTNVLSMTIVSVTNAGEKGTGWTWDTSTGALHINKASVTGNVEISLTGDKPADPIVTPNPASLDFGTNLKMGDAVPTYQTFTISGSNLTAALDVASSDPSLYAVSVTGSLTPNGDGEVSATVTVTPQAGITDAAGIKSANITISGDDLSEAVVVVASMTVQQTYTVNWYVNGGSTPEHSQTDIVNTDYDAVPDDFSAFTDCSDFHFVGWKDGSAIDGFVTEAPSLAEIGTKITANKNYYAVFAEGTPGGNVLVTSTSELTNGTKVYLYSTFVASEVTYGAVAKAFVSGNNVRATSGTVTNNKLTPGEDAGLYTIGVTENGYTFNDGTYYLRATGSDKNWLVGAAELGDDQKGEFAITISENVASISSVGNTSRGVMQFNKNGDTGDYTKAIFSCYSSASYNGIQLFKQSSPVYTKWYTTCPHVSRVNLSAATVDHGSISFAKNEAAITSIVTEGESAVTVDVVVASHDAGYGLSTVELSGVDGASYSNGVITIPANAEGTLVATATFLQKNYTVDVISYPDNIGASLTGSTTTAHYNGTIEISTTEVEGYLFDGWYLFEKTQDFDIENVDWTNDDLSSTLFGSGKDLLMETDFTMPEKDIVAVAAYDAVHDVAWAIDNTPASSPWLQNVYVKGIVTEIEELSTEHGNATYYISDLDENGAPANSYYVYRGKNVGDVDFTSADQLTVGDEVTIFGTLKTYSSKKEFDAGNYIITNGRTAAVLSSLAIVGTPSVTAYDAGQNFDKTGLSLTATYNTGYVVTNYTGTTITSDYDEGVATFSGNGNVTVTVSAQEENAAHETISTSREITVSVSNAVLDHVELAAGVQTEFWAKEQYKEPLLNAYLDDETELPGVTGVSNTASLDMSVAGNKSVTVTYTRKAGQEASVEYNFTVKPVVVDEANAHSVATAREIIDVDKTDGEDLDLELAATKTHVIGRVKSVNALTGTYAGKYTIVLEDQTDNTKTIELYRNTLGTGITSVEVGDLVKVYGNLYWFVSGSKYEINEGGEVVWKQPKVSISIANKTLEIGDVWTIDATIVPAAAPVTYSIKAGSDDCITLATNVITATAEGTATIIASAAEYNDGVDTYLANSIEFEVEVVEAGSVVPVVILAQYDGQWYALMNEYYGNTTNSLKALAVDYNEADGVLFELTLEQQAAITWTRSIAAGKATFLNGTKYIAGGTSGTDLTLNASASEWTVDGDHYMKGTRTFLYNDGGYFKNFAAASNVGKLHYSDYPVVLAYPQFMTRVNVRESLYEGKWGTICPKKEVKYPTGASFYTLTYKEEQAGMPYKVFFDEIAEGASLEAGKPYLFVADGETIKGVKVGDEAEHTDGISNNSYNGFYGILTDNYQLHVSDQNDVDNYKYYIVYGNEIRLCGLGYFNIPAERAYLDMSEMDEEPVAQVPGRRRVCLTNPAANAPTDIDAINASEKPMKLMIDGQLFILRGEKMFDATGRLVK